MPADGRDEGVDARVDRRGRVLDPAAVAAADHADPRIAGRVELTEGCGRPSRSGPGRRGPRRRGRRSSPARRTARSRAGPRSGRRSPCRAALECGSVAWVVPGDPHPGPLSTSGARCPGVSDGFGNQCATIGVPSNEVTVTSSACHGGADAEGERCGERGGGDPLPHTRPRYPKPRARGRPATYALPGRGLPGEMRAAAPRSVRPRSQLDVQPRLPAGHVAAEAVGVVAERVGGVQGDALDGDGQREDRQRLAQAGPRCGSPGSLALRGQRDLAGPGRPRAAAVQADEAVVSRSATDGPCRNCSSARPWAAT